MEKVFYKDRKLEAILNDMPAGMTHSLFLKNGRITLQAESG